MKKYLIIANWKLNSNGMLIKSFLKNLQLYLLNNKEKNNIGIAPSFVYLDKVNRFINNKNTFLVAQDVDVNLEGSFTGEVSILMLKDIGVKYVIIGHSERRFFHQEDNNIIAKKFFMIKSLNLIPILCIGETKKEKELNKTNEIIIEQIDCILKICGKEAFRNTVIAYEPIWAIGTGKSADIRYIQKIHKFIKNYIFQNDNNICDLLVQYGGSVNALNIKNFINQSDIDGFLIGNASLKYKEFLKIIKIANT